MYVWYRSVSEENFRVDTGDRLHRGDGPPSERPARGDAGQGTPGRGAAGRANPQHAPHIDDEDAFLVEIGPAHDRTGEQWARAILEDAPILVRHPLRWGWFALGLRLGATRSDRHVLGWEVRRSTPDVALLAASSRLGCRPNRSASASSTRCASPPSCNRRTRSHARCGPGVAPVHRRVVRYLLERAGRRIHERSETDER
jgi:hypothetical protein